MTERQKDRVESYRSIAASELKRSGVLIPGYSCEWQWTNQSDERVAAISLQCIDPSSVQFSYNCGGKPYEYTVHIEWLPCHMGGERAMFLCPICNKRCAKLLASNVFACRACVGVNYASQQRAKRDAANDQAWKLRRKLACDFNALNVSAHYIPKPKWMRWPTYHKIVSRIEEYDQRSLEGMVQQLKMMGIHL